MTTPLPPQPPHDEDALPGEAGLKALYDRLPAHEPGPALDAAVLRAAAQAIGTPAAAARARPRPRWPIALGTAASLVLAAGLAWQMRRLPAAAPVSSPAPTAVSAPATETSDKATRDAGMAARAAAPQAKQAVAATRHAAAPTAAAAKAITRPPPGHSPPAAARRGTGPATTGAISQRMRLPPQLVPRFRAAPGTASKHPVAPSDEHARPALAPAPVPPAPSVVPPPAMLAAPQPPAQPTPPTQLSLPPERLLPSMLAPAATPAADAPAPPAPPAPPAAALPPAPPSPPAPATPMAMPHAAPALVPAPSNLQDVEPASSAMATELQTIRTLYADGNATTARKLLDAFRQRHPHYTLPADLRAHLDDAP